MRRRRGKKREGRGRGRQDRGRGRVGRVEVKRIRKTEEE